MSQDRESGNERIRVLGFSGLGYWGLGFRVLNPKVYYFNDVEEGGETEFRGDKVIEPKQSRLVIFPSGWNYIHRGNPVLAGSKYIATCFSLYTPTPSVSSHDAD